MNYNNNNNPLNGSLSRMVPEKKHSFTHTMSLWSLYNIFNFFRFRLFVSIFLAVLHVAFFLGPNL